MSHSVKERRPENRWSPDEDEMLLSVIEQCGPVAAWSQVSACLPGRNNKSCRKRWIHSLDPTLRRWTEAEDALLTAAVETYGTRWFRVAKMLPGRTDEQCAKRWRGNLDPSISREPWTGEDDVLLMEIYEKIGKRWKDIASRFEGRPSVHCRNRVQSLIRARRRAVAAHKAANARVGEAELVTDKVGPVEFMLEPLDSSSGVRVKISPPLLTPDRPEEDFVSSDASGNPTTPKTDASELYQGIQLPRHPVLIPAHSIQEIHDNFVIASTSSQAYYPLMATGSHGSYIPHHGYYYQSTSTSPLWGTPHPQLVRSDIYGEDSWGISPSLPSSPSPFHPGLMIPGWTAPWQPQPEQAEP